MLAEFWTAIAWNVESRWNRLVPRGLSQELARRAFTDAPQGKVKCAPSREIVRLAVRSSPLERFLCSAERPFSTIGTYRHLDRVVARHLREARADAVYAYEGGGLQTFKAAERQGIGTLCEVQSSHWRWWRDLLSKEAECNPEFAGLLPRMADLSRHFAEKDEELQLADVVVVPSRHVRQTLAGVVPDKKIRVIPYGAPPVRVRERPVRDVRMPLKVLFVGLLSQSKGIGYLLDALKMLGSMVDVTLVGRRLSAHPRVDEACARWRWFESLPHAGVLERMQTADVLVLPSLAEGCSLVVLEALSCGLPVIVTPNSGTLEVVRDGREGFVVPVCRADAIAERLDTLAADRELLAGMSRNAQATAATHQWEAYRETWAETVRLPWR
jgi:glycosyltransferase involved in cell wall biosynthesis